MWSPDVSLDIQIYTYLGISRYLEISRYLLGTWCISSWLRPPPPQLYLGRQLGSTSTSSTTGHRAQYTRTHSGHQHHHTLTSCWWVLLNRPIWSVWNSRPPGVLCTPAAMVEVVWWWLPPPSIVHASDSSTPAPVPAAAADTHQHQAASRDSYISTLYWAHTTLPFVSVNILTLQPGLFRPI